METNRPSPLTKYSRQAAGIILGTGIIAGCAYMVTTWACAWLGCWAWVYSASIVAGILFVLIPVGMGYRFRAIKAARGRLPLRPVGYGLVTYGRSVTSIFHKSDQIPMRDEETRGWQVPFSDGSERVMVNVYKMALYRWLASCYTRQGWQSGNRSTLSRRSNRNLDKLQWAARIELLKRVNAVYRNSTASNSTLYLKQFEGMQPIEAAWYVVDELLEEVEESRKIW